MAGFGTLSSAEEAELPPNVLDNFVARTFGSLASLPRRAIQNSQVAVGTGTYNPAPVLEAAMLPMAATPFGAPAARAGEVALGAGPVPKAILPMDEASRLARAKAQGYNVDERVYHETARDFKEFKPEYGSQVWFTTDKGTLGQNGAAGQGRVVEAFLNNKKLGGWPEYDKYGTDELIRMGYDGLRLGKDIVTFNPKGIRSVDAKFDPAKIKSGNILAGTAGFGALLPGLLPYEDR